MAACPRRTCMGSSARPAELAYGLPQALTQLADALRRSLTVFDVYDSDREPGDSVNATIASMSAAAAAFAAAARHLSDAQNAIANPGCQQ